MFEPGRDFFLSTGDFLKKVPFSTRQFFFQFLKLRKIVGGEQGLSLKSAGLRKVVRPGPPNSFKFFQLKKFGAGV